MPYWEVLGRTAVTQGTQETADRITQFLTYSGVDATISFDEERSVYIVSVPQEQADLAEKLIKNFEEMEQAPEREAESALQEYDQLCLCVFNGRFLCFFIGFNPMCHGISQIPAGFGGGLPARFGDGDRLYELWSLHPA